MLKSVSFDLWETLITDTPALSREQERLRLTRMEEILAAGGYAALADRIEHAYRALWHRCQELYWSADKDVPCRTQIEHFLEELQIDIKDEATLSALEVDVFDPQHQCFEKPQSRAIEKPHVMRLSSRRVG